MSILYNVMVILFITTTSFCSGMNTKELVFVKTVDKKITLFEKSKINQSLVLSVLYAHQKKNIPNAIIIPQAREENDNITVKDVCALRSLLQHQGDKFVPYMKTLSCLDITDCAHAANVLGAQRQLVQVINYFFVPDISTIIGSKMINYDVQEYMIKQVIKKKEIAEPKIIEVEDNGLCAYKNGSFFYIPPEFVPYQNDIFFDGSTTFTATVFVGNDNVPLRAMSCKENYYVMEIDKTGNNQAVLWCFKENTLVRNQKKRLEIEGKITHIVFNNNETCVVVASNSAEHNLFYWALEPFGDDREFYWLNRDSRGIGKIIINDEGTYIATSHKNEAEVILWGREGRTVQKLYDNYTHPITTMAFSKNGKQLWVCSGAIISCWQSSDDGIFKLLHSMTLDGDDVIICRLLVLEQVGRIVVGRTDGNLHVISMDAYKETVCLKGHKDAPVSGLIGNDVGNIVVSSTNDITDNLMIWDIFTGECIANLVGHSGITAILLTPDMRYIASQSWHQICLWKMYGASKEETFRYMRKNLKFLDCYELYNLYKKIKNGHTIETSQNNWVLSLPVIAGVKEFVEKYLV
jgi:WD40 repeat protein